MTNTSEAQPSGKRSFRFSLLSLVFVTTIVALAITVFQLNDQVGGLQTEVRQLHNEAQSLHVLNPRMPSAIRVESDNRLLWQWRVWVPEGMKFKLLCAGDQIPAEGFPESDAELLLDQSGEHLIRYSVKQGSQDESWAGFVSVGADLQEIGDQRWAEWEDWTASDGGVTATNQQFGPEEPVELIRYRVNDKALTRPKPNQVTAGFMIWLEPQ